MKYKYESEAMRGFEMPDGLSQSEQLHFLSLRSLYAQLRVGIIDRDTATKEKGKLTYELDKRLSSESTHDKLREWTVKLFKECEGAANAYAKERTLENADRLYKTIYNLR